jgi:aerobic carbon-monoxide dehydrogenase medium subunit
VKPSAFDYHAPTTISEAVSTLARLGEGAKVLSGGQSLVPMVSLRLAYFDHLVDIGRIDELRGIANEGDTVVIGSTTTDARVEHDELVAERLPLVAKATPLIGHFQIRNRGTVGGSIAHADPAGEYPAVALVLDAEMEAVSPRGTRRIGAADFFTGFWTTALEPDELLTSVRFPVWSGRCGFAVAEFARRFGDFAIAGAVAAVRLDDADRIDRCAIALLGLGPTPIRSSTAERAVDGEAIGVDTALIGHLAMEGLDEVPSDLHGSPTYRTRVGAAMVRRALDDAIKEAADA